MQISFNLKVTMIQITTEKHYFGYFPRFVTPGLTIRPRSMYIYVFQTLFGFAIFTPSLVSFES